MVKHDPEAAKRFMLNRSADSLWRIAKVSDRNKVVEESESTTKHLATLAKVESGPIVADLGPAIDGKCMPKAVLRDKRNVRLRTTASKLSRAECGAARRGLEHSQAHKASASVWQMPGENSVQVICYDPSRDYVDADAAFAALREMSVKALPARLRRQHERAKHRAMKGEKA
jgi:hypothetical protein